MRIAYLCADLGIPVFGRKGCSIHIQEVVRAMQAHGAQVEIFTTRPEGKPPPDLASAPIHALAASLKGDRAWREQAALAANDAVRAILEREGPFDLIYERYSLWNFAGMETAQAMGTPGFLEVNAPLIEEQVQYRSLLDRAGAEKVAGRVFAAATALLAVSQEIATYLERYGGARGRVHVIPNGVDPGRFPPGLPPSLPAPAGTWTVGFVGTLKPWHGLADLVEAFALFHQRHDDTRLLIVGDGPEKARLQADLEKRGLEPAAHLVGAVEPGEVPGLLASMDVAVAPYPALEPFYFSPLKVYEYMAAGLPVIASRLGQLEELIQHGVNGMLFPAGDPIALAAALERLWQDPELCSRLGQAGRISICREHTWEGVVRMIVQLAGLKANVRPQILEATR
jgi:glycosyltransferase involved in cell wall biosynthesis